MSTIVLGCDDNDGKNAEWQNTVASALENAGHTVEKLPIDPTPFGQYSYGEAGYNPKGKIGVYIMADSLVSVADLADGGTSFKYAYFIIRMDLDLPRMSQPEHFNTSPIGRDSDCTSVCDRLAGKTYAQMNELCKDKCQITWGRNPKEGAENLIKLMGGEIASSDSNKESTGSSIKEALKKAVSKWDGDVEVRLIDDTVHVRKIPDPSTAKITIDEFNNALYDSITVTDINSETINKLILEWGDYELTLKDNTLIKRFGVKKDKIKLEEEQAKEIKTLKDAKSYLQREWNKIRRDDGRQVELKVMGHPRWKTGIWCRVYLPSYFIDDYMYISKTSHDEDGSNNWNTNITLVDYPPSFGAYEEETSEETVDDATATTDATATDVTADTEATT